ncbi:MAG TPA: DCC1-like thiol-disulfide oxidoreductase family protein [Draconibacterium sp.]|nr:DCC1-like thiol-disulfide oxidoreductase family protein [Draconibacterium sp.]
MKHSEKIILFDGVCNLCNSFMDLILGKARENQFKMIPLQSEEGQNILNKFELGDEPDTVFFIQNNHVFSESEAILEICKHLKAPWRWLGVFQILPKKTRDRFYRGVAKNRYKWFGKRANCRNI